MINYEYKMLQAIHNEASGIKINFDIKQIILWLCSAPFYAVGWLFGFLWRCVLWCVAACKAGFKAGKS